MTAPTGKATLHEAETPSKKLEFGFNPTQVAYSRSVKFNRQATPNSTSKADPPAQFTGTDPTSLQLTLLIDAMTVENGSIQPQLDQLVEWTTVPEDTPTASPPQLVFNWGSLKIGGQSAFVGFLEQLKVTIEMFARDGTPLRASVSLTLKSGALAPAGTNPTSGAEKSRKRRVLQRGQSLQSLAYSEYRDASAWRAIAELNGIDDPTRLRPGQEILLPDRRELVARL
jgi:nucleoid-associated protein YgaU